MHLLAKITKHKLILLLATQLSKAILPKWQLTCLQLLISKMRSRTQSGLVLLPCNCLNLSKRSTKGPLSNVSKNGSSFIWAIGRGTMWSLRWSILRWCIAIVTREWRLSTLQWPHKEVINITTCLTSRHTARTVNHFTRTSRGLLCPRQPPQSHCRPHHRLLAY